VEARRLTHLLKAQRSEPFFDVKTRWKIRFFRGPSFPTRGLESRKGSYVAVDGAVRAFVASHQNEEYQSSSVTIPGEQSRINFQSLF
jgi:hypothetical protein